MNTSLKRRLRALEEAAAAAAARTPERPESNSALTRKVLKILLAGTGDDQADRRQTLTSELAALDAYAASGRPDAEVESSCGNFLGVLRSLLDELQAAA